MMRALVVLVLLSIPVHAAEAIDPDVLAVREAAWRAWFGGDEAALRAMLPEEFLAIGAGEPEISDREKAIASSRSFKEAGGRLVSLAFPETRAQQFGDTVILYGSYEATFVAGGKEQQMRGRLTEVFVKRDGKWLHPGWHLDLR
ncbi:MAG TPA: nuclear transport factor 2 family protein [Thermoanaerobaculia bacterium]|nr:nuclear transport factor 2 family protein [Thermoanaerobaculia bacterium]